MLETRGPGGPSVFGSDPVSVTYPSLRGWAPHRKCLPAWQLQGELGASIF